MSRCTFRIKLSDTFNCALAILYRNDNYKLKNAYLLKNAH